MKNWCQKRKGCFILAGLGCLFLLACANNPKHQSANESKSPANGSAAPASTEGSWFIEVAQDVGLDFRHFNGMSGEYYITEIKGCGCALFDYDNDGDLDVYLVQGRMLGQGKTEADALFPRKASDPRSDRLFRNDLKIGPDGTPLVRFTDVTEAAGIRETEYGLGVAVADFNNDSFIDVYVCNFGPNHLLKNNGDGTFSDVTLASGTSEERYTVSATFADFDNDGWLDLFVPNYVDFTTQDNEPCNFSGYRDYCNPLNYPPTTDRLFRNRGDGTFEDITQKSGIAGKAGNGLNAMVADFDQNGWTDIYVANDMFHNFCWFNQGDATFVEGALLSGCGLNETGTAEASMGITIEDFDGDGDEDLFLTHLTGQTNTLYLNDGTGSFEDFTIQAGLALPSQAFTSWGTHWIDFDHDGWLDLFIANGAVSAIEALRKCGDPFPYGQRNQLFRNTGGMKFKEIDAQKAGSAFCIEEVSRGSAFGDIDNDGDTDILVTNINGPARLLLNQANTRSHWIGLRFIGPTGIRDPIGTRVALIRENQPPLWRRIKTDGSFASANDSRILFGLAAPDIQPKIEVVWPDGFQEWWTGLSIDAWATLEYGKGNSGTPSALASSRASPLSSEEFQENPSPERTTAVLAVDHPDLTGLEPQAKAQTKAFRRALKSALSQSEAHQAEAYGKLGVLYFAYGYLSSAEACLTNAHTLDKNNLTWCYLLGRLLLEGNRQADARVFLEKAHDMNPEYTPAIVALADVFRQQNRPQSARDLLQNALNMDPENPLALMVLGQIRMQEKQFQEAAELFDRALTHQPSASSIHYLLALALKSLGKTELAQQHMELRGDCPPSMTDPIMALVLEPRGRSHFRLAETLRHLGKNQDASVHFDAAVYLLPKNPGARMGRLLNLIQIGQHREAIHFLGQDIAALPQTAAFYHLAARLFAASPDEQVRDGAQALSLLERFDSDGISPEVVETLAMAFAEVGQFDRAIRFQEKAIQMVQSTDQKEFLATLAKNMELYRNGKPCREPWLPNDPLFQISTYAPE